MPAKSAPRQPDGLGTAGKALWKEVLADLPGGWEFDRRELGYLTLACRQADHLSALEAVIVAEGVMSAGSTGQPVVHPAVVEARQARLAVSRLLGAIPMEGANGEEESAASTRGRKAAQARWRQQAERRGVRNA
jgi:phage terminase small subunit